MQIRPDGTELYTGYLSTEEQTEILEAIRSRHQQGTLTLLLDKLATDGHAHGRADLDHHHHQHRLPATTRAVPIGAA